MKVRHRPETGTPVENSGGGEWLVALSERIGEFLDDWMAHLRPAVTYARGSNPLPRTRPGPIPEGTLGKYVYSFTRPCAVGEDCPHERDPGDSMATGSGTLSGRPSSVGPSGTRRERITPSPDRDVPDLVVGDPVT